MKFRKLLLAALIAAPFAAAAGLVLPPTTGYFTYGNTNSYSLPLLAAGYDNSFGGGVGPGNPFYVSSTPGAIKDQVVIYTGSGGTDVTHNDTGFENAYGAPNGHNDPYAFMNTSANAGPEKMIPPPDPKPATEIKNQTPNSWDASVAALRGFLKGGTPIFLFNNNETNADQTLAIWARLWLTNSAGTLVNRSLYLTNEHNDPAHILNNCALNTACPYDANFVGGSKGGVENGNATLFNLKFLPLKAEFLLSNSRK